MKKPNGVNIKQVLKVFLLNPPLEFCEGSFKGLRDKNVKEILNTDDSNDIRIKVCNLLREEHRFTDREMRKRIFPLIRLFQGILEKMDSIRDEIIKDNADKKVKGLVFFIYTCLIIKKFFKSIYDVL